MGQTAATLVVPRAAADKQIRVEVTASKPGFPASDTIESAPTDPISFEQIEVVTNPSVSGTPAVGATLTAQPGVWNPADVDLEYQWSVDGVEINGATGVTFVPQEAHAGKSVMVEVTASKLDFESAQATSAPTSPLTIITLTNTAPPVISGTPTVGATLTATVGGWSASQGTWNQSGATITYTWYQGETEVSSGTSNTYVVPASAVGKAIVVTVTISKPGYRTTGIVVSAPTGIVPVPAVANVVNPSVVGVPVVGGVLTARPGAWSESGVTYSYRWFANGVAIAGATGSAYKVPVAHLGKQITVGVSASKTGFVKSVEARSVATAKVGYASSVAVKTKNKKKRKVEFKVTVKSNRKAVRGKVAVYRGNTLVKSGNLNKKGKVTIKLSKQPAGKHTYSIRYLGSGHAKPRLSSSGW